MLSLHPTIDTGVAKRLSGGALHPEADALPGHGLATRRAEAPAATSSWQQRPSALRPRSFGSLSSLATAAPFNRSKRRLGMPPSSRSGQHGSREPPQKRRPGQGGVQMIDLEEIDIDGQATVSEEQLSPSRPA